MLMFTTHKKKPSPTKIEKRYEQLLEKVLEEQNKLEKISNKIEKHEIIERINIKEETELVKRIETEILDETKALEEIRTKLRKVKTLIDCNWTQTHNHLVLWPVWLTG